MGKAWFEIIECRLVVCDDWTEVYVAIRVGGDAPAVGGWYKKIIPKHEPAIPYLWRAIEHNEFFEWDKGAPPK